jgi:rhodanese-related sulfurtransferase
VESYIDLFYALVTHVTWSDCQKRLPLYFLKIKSIQMRSIILLIAFFTIIGCKENKAATANGTPASESTSIVSEDQTVNTNIDVNACKAKMKANKEVVLIDVRTDGEVNQGKISNALHIDISKPDFDQKINALDKNKEYIVYCAVGGRSSRAVSQMQQKGFKKVFNMAGGYNAWVKN